MHRFRGPTSLPFGRLVLPGLYVGCLNVFVKPPLWYALYVLGSFLPLPLSYSVVLHGTIMPLSMLW